MQNYCNYNQDSKAPLAGININQKHQGPNKENTSGSKLILKLVNGPSFSGSS